MFNPFTNKRWLILIVDRSQEVVDFVGAALRTDYDVIQALSGAEAIEQYKKFRPDLIIMEVDREHPEGYEICREIKEAAGRRFTPVIFISHQSDLASIKKGLQSGAEDYLSKPFEPEELFVRVQATLRTKKLYTQLMKAYEIIESERDIIAEIQQGLLCKTAPSVPGFDFFFKYQPSSKAGGDYYDFIKVDADHLGLLVADVSGHGTPATVIMAIKRVLLHSFLSHTHSPKATLEKLNAILCENFQSGHFITAFYGVVHLPTRTMKYASAGHNPPLLLDSGSGNIRELWADHGFPLMIFPRNVMSEHEVKLTPDSKLVLYTDGLIEVRDKEGEVFGFKRFADAVLRHGRGHGAERAGTLLLDDIQAFASGSVFHDDYTLMIVETGPA